MSTLVHGLEVHILTRLRFRLYVKKLEQTGGKSCNLKLYPGSYRHFKGLRETNFMVAPQPLWITKKSLHQSLAASTRWCGPRVGSKWLLAFSRVPVTPGTPLIQTIFSPCCPLNDRRRAARSFFEVGHLSSLFSCLSLGRLCLLIFLLLLMSGNVHLHPSPSFHVKCALEI